ncbi:MAG: Hpt domain-containing protein [Proteobacteria bacterium]|nr:Hpt domain-containing protein [Pseudomonadota bacterium]
MIVEVDKELRDVFPRFLKSREEEIAALDHALEKKDFDSIRNISHKVSGKVGGYGLVGFAELAKNLEDAASIRKYDLCRELVNRMRLYLKELQPKFV